MDEELEILLERAARYRDAARTVAQHPIKDVLLTLANGYVSLVQLLIEHPGYAGPNSRKPIHLGSEYGEGLVAGEAWIDP